MGVRGGPSSLEAAVDVLVLGEHPSAAFAAALLASGGKLNVLHVVPPLPPRTRPAPDRLVWINPALFQLSPLLAPLRATLPTTPSFGLQFLTADPAVRSRYRSPDPVALVASYSALRTAMNALAKAAGARCVAPKQLSVESVDETGVSLRVGKSLTKAKLLILSDGVPDGREALLGLHAGWTAGVPHRYTSVRCPKTVLAPSAEGGTLSVCLNLDRSHHWGWLLPGEDEVQLTVEQSVAAKGDGGEAMLAAWVKQLQAAGVLDARAALPASRIELTLPVGGALLEEAVANRTLLIGPAGGFVSACGEEIYPGCWSAVFADKVARKALRERHLQDALQPFREVWRTTLGEYLRGPRENLPFLLSLVYRNAVLTDRLAEAILHGKPVVR